MNFDYLIRVRKVIALLILLAILSFALLSNLQLFRQEARLNPQFVSSDAITAYERRFEGLRKMLPPRGVVGYITDKGVTASDSEATQYFFLTQYALSPLIVIRDLNHQFVVGNSLRGAIDYEVLALSDFTLLKDFGNGVMLFKREPSPALAAAPGANPAPVYAGFHSGADCEEVYGWAWDRNQPNSPISVDIYDGNSRLATVKASLFRQDLLRAGIGSGYYGFSYALPPSLRDGQSHSIWVKFSRTDISLGNSPKSLTCIAN